MQQHKARGRSGACIDGIITSQLPQHRIQPSSKLIYKFKHQGAAVMPGNPIQSPNQQQPGPFTSLFSHQEPSEPATTAVQEHTMQLRRQTRQTHIDNYRHTARFSRQIQDTISYLKSIEYRPVESEAVLDQALRQDNLQYLVELVVSADPMFRAVLLGKKDTIMWTVNERIGEPSSVMLLGNLCALYDQFISASLQFGLVTKISQLMHSMKRDPKCCCVCAWTLAQMTRVPSLLHKTQLQSVLPGIYSVFIEMLGSSEPFKNLCTYLCQIVNHIAMVMSFDEDFLAFLASLKPERVVDSVNLVLAWNEQVRQMQYSENTPLRIRIVEYLLAQQPKHLKQASVSLYSLLATLVCKSQPELASYICEQHFQPLLSDYRPSDQPYHRLLQQLLHRHPNLISEDFLANLRKYGLLENMIDSINGAHRPIGYLCVRGIRVLMKELLSKGMVEGVEWALGLGLQAELEQLLEGQRRCEHTQEAEQLLDMIQVQ